MSKPNESKNRESSMKKYIFIALTLLLNTTSPATIMQNKNILPLVTIDQPNHSVLRNTAKPITFPLNAEAIKTIAELKATFASLKSPYGKPAGLAAPQIGIPLRMFIVQIPPEAKQKRHEVYDTLPPTVFMNPTYHPLLQQGKYSDIEGCYSVPNKTGEVSRYFTIDFTAYTESGKKIHRIAKGFLARLLQHETDHLNGIVFSDYLSKPTA